MRPSFCSDARPPDQKRDKDTNYAPITVCLQNYIPELFWVILLYVILVFCSCFAPLSTIHPTFFFHLSNSGSRGERCLTPWTGRQFIIYFLLLCFTLLPVFLAVIASSCGPSATHFTSFVCLCYRFVVIFYFILIDFCLLLLCNTVHFLRYAH